MNASVLGLYRNKKAWGIAEHNGRKFTRAEMKRILEYSIIKGIKDTINITDEIIESALTPHSYTVPEFNNALNKLMLKK